MHFLFCYRTIKGHIDQSAQVLHITQVDPASSRYEAIDKWTKQLAAINLSISERIE